MACFFSFVNVLAGVEMITLIASQSTSILALGMENLWEMVFLLCSISASVISRVDVTSAPLKNGGKTKWSVAVTVRRSNTKIITREKGKVFVCTMDDMPTREHNLPMSHRFYNYHCSHN